MAIAERCLAHRFNRPGHDDRRPPHVRLVSATATSWRGSPREAASLAGHLKLGKLVYLYDDEPRHARRARVAELHRGRPAALRGLRLAGPARRERQHRPRRHRPRDPGRPIGQTGTPDDHRRADHHRLRLAEQGRHVARRTAARSGPRKSPLTKKALGLGMDGALLCARRGAAALPRARSRGA